VYPFEGCLPINGGADVLWTGNGNVLLIQREGEAECLLSLRTPNVNSQTVVYDGRYVWATAVFGSDKLLPEVWVIDPRSKKRWQITAAHGLPLHPSKKGTIETRGHQTVMVAPVSPGKAVIAGAFGRTWLASVTFDPEGNHDVDVFHEAPQIGGYHPRLTTIAFIPWYMATLTPPTRGAATTGTRVLVGRSIPGRGDITPLLVDVDRLTVKAQPNKCYTRSRSDVCRGAVYQVTVLPPRLDALCVSRFGLPDLTPEVVLDDVKEGIVIWQGDMINVVGKQWWRGSPADGELACYGNVPWIFDTRNVLSGPSENRRFEPGDIVLERIARSNIYGLLVSYHVRGGSPRRKPVQIVFDPPAGVPTTIPVQQLASSYRAPRRTVIEELDRDAVLAFSPDGHAMARGGHDGVLSLWSTDNWQQLGKVASPGRGIQDLAFSPDGRLLAASIFDSTVRVWDVETKSIVFEAATPTGIAQRVAVHSDGHLVATNFFGVRLWDMKTGHSTLIETLHEIAGFLPDGRLVGCTNSYPRRLVAWDVDRGTYRRLWEEVVGELIGVSLDGRYLYAVKHEGGLEGHRGEVRRLRVWDLATRRLVIDNREHEAVKFMAETPHRVVINTSMLPPSETSAER
jgi:hypothetical protein